MSRRRIAAAALALAALVPAAEATRCAADVAPAATLLFPYFETDLAWCNGSYGLTTLVSIGNATPAPVLAGVTLWSDWGVPVMGFQVYLPGYAVQAVNLADIFCSGLVPRTGPAVSPHGPSSDPPVDFAGCNNSAVPDGAPNYALPMDPFFQLHVVASLTGQPSPYDGSFRGQDHGDNVARGFVTVDTLNGCGLQFPGDAGYFAPGGTGTAANVNALFGEMLMVDLANNFAQGFAAAHLEADDFLFGIGDYTFYGAKGSMGDWLAYDGREPLPTTFAAPFASGGPESAFSSILAWRERLGPLTGSPGPFVPNPLPLSHDSLVSFDESTAAVSSWVPPVLPGEQGYYLAMLPFVAGSYHGDEGSHFSAGWKLLDLQTFQIPGGPSGQSWVLTLRGWEGRFSTGTTAVALDSSCTDTSGTPLNVSVTPSGGIASDPYTPWVFWADFEDALGGWSQVVGTP